MNMQTIAGILKCTLNAKTALIFFAILSFLISFDTSGQVVANKKVGRHAPHPDSLKVLEYPYALPIWGEKAAKMGFDLPYSAGIGLNYMWQESNLIIDNLKVGFNNGPQYELDEIVRFNSATSTSNGLNFRPDIWVFPFLNMYGIIAKTQLSTAVDFTINAPDADGNWQSLSSFSTVAEFNATSLGFGMTPTIGVGGGWFALDMNVSWTDVPQLSEPAFAFVFGPRMGKTFKLKKPQRTITTWVGGFRLKLNSGTNGSMNFNELFDTEGLQVKIDDGIAKIGDIQAGVDSWWDGLSNLEQNNPVNQAKYETANRALDRAGEFLGNMNIALNDEEYSSVQYSLDKRPEDMWNFLIGAQYQHSKHWMIRGELGIFGTRTQFLGGLQYRFGL